MQNPNALTLLLHNGLLGCQPTNMSCELSHEIFQDVSQPYQALCRLQRRISQLPSRIRALCLRFKWLPAVRSRELFSRRFGLLQLLPSWLILNYCRRSILHPVPGWHRLSNHWSPERSCLPTVLGRPILGSRLAIVHALSARHLLGHARDWANLHTVPGGNCIANRGGSSLGVCQPCTDGQSAPQGSATCTLCQPGTYSNIATGYVTCTPCAAGTFSSISGAAACQSCLPGQFSNPGAQTCSSCPAGTYTDGSSGFASCTQCPAGTASPTGGGTSSAVCAACAPGQFAPAGSTSCSSCGLGTYSDANTGLATCTPCPPNTASGIFLGASSCQPCAPGQYSNAGASTCSNCPPGTYSNLGTGFACTACAAGTYSQGGQASCTPCPSGTSWPGCADVSGCLAPCTTAQTAAPPVGGVSQPCPNQIGEIIGYQPNVYYSNFVPQCVPATITIRFRAGISCIGPGPFQVAWYYGSPYGTDTSSLNIKFSDPQCSCNATLQDPQSFTFTPATLPFYQVQNPYQYYCNYYLYFFFSE